jgi:para-aminobenzoate synthetase/4-amino-4-deoxychorismate lyase
MDNPFLLQTGASHWLRFHSPNAVVKVDSPSDVMAALSEIEGAVQRDGLYAAGFLAYEAASAFDPALKTHPPGGIPLLWFGLYEPPEILSGPPPRDSDQGFTVGPWQPSITESRFQDAFDCIKEHIALGDTYQVNHTFRLRADFDGSPRAFFLDLSRAQGAGYAAYLETGDLAVCSASPELFFHLDGDRLVSKPMKGTLRRSPQEADDSSQEARLRASDKDRAENLMIVDMVRNDLGRIAQVGSVRVPRLFEIERYPTVFQMTSTVECRTQAGFPEIMAALFPCASITGAPKVRTMEIIRSLEPDTRGLYTGCIGTLAPGRQALFNVAIRTAVIDHVRHNVEYGVGGGIVWDSDCSQEYQECLDKAQILPGIWQQENLSGAAGL